MKLDEYSKIAITTFDDKQDFGDLSPQLIYAILGLAGESGEVVEKFKKLYRNKNGILSDEDKKEIIKELGDVLWYINTITTLLGANLEDVAQANLDKLLSRKERGVIRSEGDNR